MLQDMEAEERWLCLLLCALVEVSTKPWSIHGCLLLNLEWKTRKSMGTSTSESPSAEGNNDMFTCKREEEQVHGSIEGVVEETTTTVTGGASVEKGDSGAYEGVRIFGA